MFEKFVNIPTNEKDRLMRWGLVGNDAELLKE
jgi:hypothetical protein